MDDPGHVWVSPAGSGPALHSAFGVNWPGPVDATIHVILRDQGDDPIAFYPAEDIWIGGAGESALVTCVGGAIADADTDADGYTTISSAFRAGGQVLPGTQPDLCVAGNEIDADLPLTINSPDVNGDLVVGLSDVVLMVQALGGAYDFRYDFNGDGAINLGDIIVMVPSMGETCP